MMPKRGNMAKSTKEIKNNTFSLLLALFSFIFLIVYLIKVDGVNEVTTVLRTAHFGWLVAAVACMLVYWLLDAIVLHISVRMVDPSHTFRFSLRLTMIGQYFNNVTPFASGGQPAQAFFMIRRGAPVGKTMTALLTKFIVYQITLTVYCLATLILKFSYFMSEVKVLMVAVIVGFTAHTAVTLMLVGVAFFKSATERIALLGIRILAKIRIVKDPAAKAESVLAELENFHEQFQIMRRHKAEILKMCLITVVQLTVYFLIGNVIYNSFHLTGTDSLTLLASQAFVLMIATFVPIPGALGAADGSFAIFFSLFFPQHLISFALVLWRLLTFYLPIVIGLFETLIEKKRAAVPRSAPLTESTIPAAPDPSSSVPDMPVREAPVHSVSAGGLALEEVREDSYPPDGRDDKNPGNENS